TRQRSQPNHPMRQRNQCRASRSGSDGPRPAKLTPMRDNDGKRPGVDGPTWRQRVTSASLAYNLTSICGLASICSLVSISVLGCDLLPNTKPDSNIELVVAKTTPSEGLNPR